MKKKVNEEAIPAYQKAVNTKHAEGMPKKPSAVTDKVVSEPKSGVNQKQVDNKHAEKMPKGEKSASKKASSGVNQKKVDSAAEPAAKKLGKASEADKKKVAPPFSAQLQTAVDKMQENPPKAPEDVARVQAPVNQNLWKSIEGEINKITNQNNSTGVLREEKKEDPKAKVRNKPAPVFDNKSNDVLDNKDHYPINTEARARNALQRMMQHKESPKWYKGTLKQLRQKIISAVKKAYPDIEIDVKP